MKVALYLRCSTENQTTDNQSLQLERYCQTKGYDIIDIFTENESAWRNGHQRELARLIDNIRSGKKKYDAVIVWALDRLTREGIGTLISLSNTFHSHGVKLISLQESWTEYPNEMTPMFLAMMGFFAKWESDRKSQRTRAGLARAIREGKTLGRPRGSKDKGKRKHTGYLLRYADRDK